MVAGFCLGWGVFSVCGCEKQLAHYFLEVERLAVWRVLGVFWFGFWVCRLLQFAGSTDGNLSCGVSCDFFF
jgi:hypothetical protein